MNIKKLANTTLQFLINRLIEILAIGIFIIGLLLLIALIYYSPTDPNFIFPQNTEIQNLLGFQGSYVSDLFLQSIGIMSYLISLTIICKFLVSYIKTIRTGDPNEDESTYWMFSYDFKSQNKNWLPEEKNFLKRKRKRNTLIFLLYINVFLIFLTFNSFIAHLLDIIVNTQRFNYPT